MAHKYEAAFLWTDFEATAVNLKIQRTLSGLAPKVSKMQISCKSDFQSIWSIEWTKAISFYLESDYQNFEKIIIVLSLILARKLDRCIHILLYSLNEKY